ncbi:phosphotransferase family protein [Actinopolymorpha pittospori]|uniref:Ser/Thr protein kinase RdoA (MazF antagonist) n=1 Tax=Actinopolymorpha pittospori TaxID=648752 RepID=A0A927RDH3_9ACTN|nr:phosphotransferase [Actinopolymorpha pittospori]MBE1608145.1 Ser/Thr protein kinase RdoA (MazF antagonist) [Actinopolymorpha pittospori]
MVTEPRVSLTSEHVAGLLPVAACDVELELIATGNHTWRVAAGGEIFYIKVHTKPWYGGKPDGSVVRHEITAHRLLHEQGLPTPEVISSSFTCDNPLQWPFMLTRALDGTALTDLLPQLARDEADQVPRQVGAHLARMHSITFEHPGYLVDGPPLAPPDPNQWQHGIWRFERFLTGAISSWADVKDDLDLPTADALASLVAAKMADLRASYQPPRFVHGDCHANQFFLSKTDGSWRVSGVLDMEVASAGSPLSDFLKFVIEMAGRFGAGPLRWWEPVLDGYGSPVDFDLLRLGLTAAGHINYTCLGPHAWPGTRAEIVRHLVRARNWSELLDLTQIENRLTQRAAGDEVDLPHGRGAHR